MSSAPPIIPISYRPDEVIDVRRGYGSGVQPADFIDAFTAFVRDNQNRIAALQIVLTHPRDLTRESLRELKIALDAHTVIMLTGGNTDAQSFAETITGSD